MGFHVTRLLKSILDESVYNDNYGVQRMQTALSCIRITAGIRRITKAMVAMFGYSPSSKKLEAGANAAIRAARELKAIEQDENKRFILT